jgi:hypothetical protein
MDKLKFCCSCTKEINEEEKMIKFYEIAESLNQKEVKIPFYQKIKCFFGIHFPSFLIYDYIAFHSLENFATLIDICDCCQKVTRIKHLRNNDYPFARKIKAILHKEFRGEI